MGVTFNIYIIHPLFGISSIVDCIPGVDMCQDTKGGFAERAAKEEKQAGYMADRKIRPESEVVILRKMRRTDR